MTLQDWVDESRERIDEHGLVEGSIEAGKAFWTGAFCRFGEHVWNYGDTIFEHGEWDVLLVLDTCRPDVLEEVAADYDYLPADVPTRTSAASASIEWVDKNLRNDEYAAELAETAYVTGNLFSENIEDGTLLMNDEVWQYGWSNEVYTTPPEVLADRAIDVHRSHDPDRMIVHFMQPHAPYRTLIDRYPDWFNPPNPEDDDDPSHPAWQLWENLRHGVISHEEVWEAYRDNLRWVLDDGVDLILENVDADRVAITADHAEAFGEWGLYAHPPYAPAPVLKNVPWVVTSAEDTGSYEPTVEAETPDVEEDELNERLRALGYK
jgi:hypothetical protein